MPFPKFCTYCGKKFQPTGKFQKVCEDCRSKHGSKRKKYKNSENIKN